MLDLTPHHISLTLHAICYSHPLPMTPLFQLRCFPYEKVRATDVVMSDWLVNLIHRQTNHQCVIHQLPPLTLSEIRQSTEAAITSAYAIHAVHLQAWMILYARVARADLSLNMTRIGDLANIHPRTLRRRQQLGVHCLYAHIIRLERDHNN